MPVEIIAMRDGSDGWDVDCLLSDGRRGTRHYHLGVSVPEGASLQVELDAWGDALPSDEQPSEPPAESAVKGYAYEVRLVPGGAEIVTTWPTEPVNLAAELDEAGVALRDVAAALAPGPEV